MSKVHGGMVGGVGPANVFKHHVMRSERLTAERGVIMVLGTICVTSTGDMALNVGKRGDNSTIQYTI